MRVQGRGHGQLSRGTHVSAFSLEFWFKDALALALNESEEDE